MCLRLFCFKYQIVLCRTIFSNSEKNLTGILFHNKKNTTENFFICSGCSHILPSDWVTCDSCPQIIEPSKTESCGQNNNACPSAWFFFEFMYYLLCLKGDAITEFIFFKSSGQLFIVICNRLKPGGFNELSNAFYPVDLLLWVLYLACVQR